MKHAIIRGVCLVALASLTACVSPAGTTPVASTSAAPTVASIENGVNSGCHIATAAEADPAAASLIEHNDKIIAGQTIVCLIDAALVAQAQAAQPTAPAK